MPLSPGSMHRSKYRVACLGNGREENQLGEGMETKGCHFPESMTDRNIVSLTPGLEISNTYALSKVSPQNM